MSWIKSGSNLKLRLVLTVHVCPVDENNINPLLNLCLFVVTQTHEHPSFLSLSLSPSCFLLVLSSPLWDISLSLSLCASFQMFWIWIFVPLEILPPLRSLSLSLSPWCACCPCLSLPPCARFLPPLCVNDVLQPCLLYVLSSVQVSVAARRTFGSGPIFCQHLESLGYIFYTINI